MVRRRLVLGVSAAGALGALTRFIVDGFVKACVPPTTAFPWVTVSINISGSFLLGVVTGLVLLRSTPSELQVLLGVCTSDTTFGTLVGRRATPGAAVATMAAAGVGLWIGAP